MPFDPDQPATDTPISAAAMRAQLNGLKELIDAIPAGPPGPEGPPGPQGPAFAATVVDAVITLPSGSPAAVSTSFDGSAVHFTFQIPAGLQGDTGSPGEVSQAALDGAIADTALNPSGVADLSLGSGDPVIQAIEAKINELLGVLRR